MFAPPVAARKLATLDHHLADSTLWSLLDLKVKQPKSSPSYAAHTIVRSCRGTCSVLA
jgi:hypothetical protein